jgi:hypothetical protein
MNAVMFILLCKDYLASGRVLKIYSKKMTKKIQAMILQQSYALKKEKN